MYPQYFFYHSNTQDKHLEISQNAKKIIILADVNKTKKKNKIRINFGYLGVFGAEFLLGHTVLQIRINKINKIT